MPAHDAFGTHSDPPEEPAKLMREVRLGDLSGERFSSYEEAIKAYEASKQPLELREPGTLVRQFDSGATRSADAGRPDYEGYLSPLVIRRYGEFMLKHQVQKDGKERTSDNWQKGMPLDSYIKSLWRHFVDLWLIHRGWSVEKTEFEEEALCAIIFNASGYLHERLKGARRDESVG